MIVYICVLLHVCIINVINFTRIGFLKKLMINLDFSRMHVVHKYFFVSVHIYNFKIEK